MLIFDKLETVASEGSGEITDSTNSREKLSLEKSKSCLSPTHVKTHKLLQTCKQVVTSLFTNC